MYFEKHVCNSRTTEPERSLWRPATSKSPQRCKVASPPPPAHCPRSTSRVVRIVRLQRHCCEVAISRECRRHSKCIQREAVVDGPLPSSTSTQQRPLAHDAEASRRDSASAEGTVASRGAASAETASRRAPCATPHDGRLAADVRYKINSNGHIQVRHESMLTSATTKIHAVHASMRASLLCDKAATSSRATRRSTCASHAKFPFFSHKWSRNGCDRALTWAT